MPEEKKPDVVSLNGVDLSPFVEQIELGKDRALSRLEDHVRGLRALGPISLSGTWDDGQEICVRCQQRFTPGPEGTAIASEISSGAVIGPVCPACAVALVKD